MPRPGSALAFVGLVLAACGDAPPVAPLEASLHGARVVYADGARVFDVQMGPILRLPGQTAATAQLRCRGRPLGRWRAEPGGGALLLRLTDAPAHCADAAIEVEAGGRRRRWGVRWRRPPRELPAVQRLRSGGLAGPPTEPANDEEALWLPLERANLIYRTGQPGAAIEAWRAAAAAARRLGALSEEARRLQTAAFMALRVRRFEQARGLLGQARALDARIAEPEVSALLGFYEARLAMDLGRLREATRHLTAAAQAATLVGATRTGAFIAAARADLAARQGRLGEAAGLLAAIEPPPSERARHLVNLGWLLVSDPPARPHAGPHLEAAVDAAREAGWAPLLANALTNHAWWALQRGDLGTARAELDEASALGADRVAAVFADVLRGELALAAGDLHEAGGLLALAERQARAEVGGGDCEACWRARLGQCRVRRALGDPGARADCLGALAEVDRLGTGTGLHAGRAQFFAARRALLAETLDLLRAEGDLDRAFGVADGAQARVLRAMQARARLEAMPAARAAGWGAQLARFHETRDALLTHATQADLVAGAAAQRWRIEDARLRAAHDAAFTATFEFLDDVAPLTAPGGAHGVALRRQLAPDEALLALITVDDRRLSFWLTPQTTRAAWLDAGADPLDPWRGALPGVSHLYVVPGGHPAGLRVHRDAYRSASVSYLPYAGVLTQPRNAGEGAVLIADTRSDLPATAAAARGLAPSLKARPFIGRAATRDAVLPTLANAALIHFAGHGVLREDDPWAAHLALARGGQLALPDVITQPLSADLVVLSGCETGPDALILRDDVVGLPEAFLAAGAGSVIASDRPVPDRDTAALFTRFYAEGGREHPAAALRRATLALGEVGYAFRLFGRR